MLRGKDTCKRRGSKISGGYLPTRTNNASLGQEQVQQHSTAYENSMLAIHKRDSSSSSQAHLQPSASSTSTYPLSQSEIRRVSGHFNAPTHIEIARHDENKKHRRVSHDSPKHGKLKAIGGELKLLGGTVKTWFSE